MPDEAILLPDVNVQAQRTVSPTDALDLSDILPLIPNQKSVLDQAIAHLLSLFVGPQLPSYGEGQTIPIANDAAIGDLLTKEYEGQGGQLSTAREDPLVSAIALAQFMKSFNDPDDENFSNRIFSAPQYPKILPQINPITKKVLKPTMSVPLDPLGPPQAAPRRTLRQSQDPSQDI